MANDEWGWKDILTGLATVGFVAGTVYLSEKAAEEKMDRLLSMPLEKALLTVASEVPPMDNDTWQAYQNRLSRYAPYSNQAEQLLYFARSIVRAENEISQLLQYPPSHTHGYALGLLRSKNQIEQLAFMVSLQANNDIRARSLLGNLLNG